MREAFVDGLTAGGRAQLRMTPGGTEADELRHAGWLAGHLTASQGGRQVQPLYFRYTTGLATGPGQTALGELAETDLLNAHRFACAWAERRGAITETQEENLFCWLLDQAGVTLSPELRRRMRAMRAGRQEVVARRLARRAQERGELP